MTAAKEAITAQLPPGAIDPATLPVEATNPCRAQSNIPFIGAGGVFTSVTVTTGTTPTLMGRLTTVGFDLKLNPAHDIRPQASIPNCPMDGVAFQKAGTQNVFAILSLEYVRDKSNPTKNKVTNVKIRYAITDNKNPAMLAVRVKFEEGVGDTPNVHPKRVDGVLKFPA